jgi:hypothetical protein
MTDTTSPAVVQQAMAFATRLRRLAELVELNPGVKLPYDVSVSAGSDENIDRWAAALRAAGLDFTDITDEHGREIRCNAVALWLHRPHDESMRRYRAGLEFIKQHAAEVNALAAQ